MPKLARKTQHTSEEHPLHFSQSGYDKAQRRFEKAKRAWDDCDRRIVSDAEIDRVQDRIDRYAEELREIGPATPLNKGCLFVMLNISLGFMRLLGLHVREGWLAGLFGGILFAVPLVVLFLFCGAGFKWSLFIMLFGFLFVSAVNIIAIRSAQKKGIGRVMTEIETESKEKGARVAAVKPDWRDAKAELADLEQCREAEDEYRESKTELDQFDRWHALAGEDWQRKKSDSFDEFIAEVFRIHGYKVSPIPKGERRSVEMIVDDGRERWAVRCCGSSGPLSRSEVEAFIEDSRGVKNDRLLLVVKSQLADNANDVARSNDVMVIASGQIENLIDSGFEAAQ
jgi:hypothetical protein